jgi:hypothetical protein
LEWLVKNFARDGEYMKSFLAEARRKQKQERRRKIPDAFALK